MNCAVFPNVLGRFYCFCSTVPDKCATSPATTRYFSFIFLFSFFLNCRLSFLIQIRRNFCESKCDKMVNLEEIFDKNLYLFFYYYIIFSSRFFFIVSSFLSFKSRGIFVIFLRCAKRSKDCYKVFLYRNYFCDSYRRIESQSDLPNGQYFFLRS